MRELADLFKALGDEKRLQILRMLSEGETCVCEFIEILGISQPAVSHHMKILKQAGLIHDRREGRWIYYRLNVERFDHCQQMLVNNFINPIQSNLFVGTGNVKNALCNRLDQLQKDNSKGGK
jgi:ArsR family transcriptional regulator